MYKSLILCLSVFLAIPNLNASAARSHAAMQQKGRLSGSVASAQRGLLRYRYGLVATPDGSAVKVRARADAHSSLVSKDAVLPVGTTVKIDSLAGSWARIHLDDGMRGWVRWRNAATLYVTPFPNGTVARRPALDDGSRTLEMGAK
jgi:hypothetical protein